MMYAYAVGPIDWGWSLLHRIDEFTAKLSSEEGYEDMNSVIEKLMSSGGDVTRKFEKAKKLAVRAGWEGDVRGSVYVFVIPGDDIEMVYGFVWKQDNNGTTFVVSPVKLPHLDDSYMVSE